MKQLYQIIFCVVLLPVVLVAADKVTITDTVATAPAVVAAPDTVLQSSDSTNVGQSGASDTAVAGAVVAAKRASALQPAAAKQGQRAAATATPVERASTRKIKLIKREYNYRQQVVLAVGMMAFIAIMMTTAQSLNPK